MLRIISIGSFFLFTLFLSNHSWAASSNEENQAKRWADWSEVKTLYDAQKYEESLITLQNHAQETAEYHYNLGNIYYRLGRLGDAVAHLEKANHMRPHESDIQYNLSLVKSTLSRSLGSDKIDPASTWIEKMGDRMPRDEARAVLALLSLIALALCARGYLKYKNLRVFAFSSQGLLALSVFFISFSLLGVQKLAEANPPAICLVKQSIRSGPGDHYLTLGKVEEGSKVRLLGPTADSAAEQSNSPPPPRETWRQIRFSEEGIGWLKASTLQEV